MLRRVIQDTDEIVVDYETTGLPFDPEARVFAYSLTWANDGYTEIYRGDFKAIENVWESQCTVIAHNLKFELHFTDIMRWDWRRYPSRIMHDTMVMHQYIDNQSTSHALDYLYRRYNNGEGLPEWDAVEKAVPIYKRYDLIPAEIMELYQRADGMATALLYRTFKDQVAPWDEYLNEIELIKATINIEHRGIMIDKRKSQELILEMEVEIEHNRIETDAIVGRHINLGSPAQLLRYFTESGISVTSTNNEMLNKIDHPIVDCILKHRAYTRGIATITDYIERSRIDGRIHPSINTNGARTGRESSSNPNLQNVSKEVKIGVKYTVPARRCFRASPGYFLLFADYAGIEMRLGVQATESPRLIKLCAKDYDFHDAFAIAFYGDRYINEKDPALKKGLRSKAKNARFAMFYGAGIYTTAKTLGLTIEETENGFLRDRQEFPEFYALMDYCTDEARRTGGIQTFFGRFLRVEAERPYAATDYLIQGSAAALFKHAQVACREYRILLPVHDELVFEFPRSDLKRLPEITKQISILMTDFPQIKVKLKVEFSMSTYTWDQKRDVLNG